MKQSFKMINDKIPRNICWNVEKALDMVVLSLDLVLRCTWSACDMMGVYRMLQASCCTVATKAIPYAEIMKMKVTRMSHLKITVGWMPKVAAAASASC